MVLAARRAGCACVVSEPQVGRGREGKIVRDIDAATRAVGSRRNTYYRAAPASKAKGGRGERGGGAQPNKTKRSEARSLSQSAGVD